MSLSLGTTALLTLTLALGSAAVPINQNPCPRMGKAIYLITNDQENAVAAIPIGQDGMLSGGCLTVTGGQGSNAIDGMTDEPIVPDALVSQSALAMAGHSLFAVNAASNTLTMLSISPSDPTHLTPLGSPVQLPGEFPNTVAASPTHNIVCVGMTGAASGVSCAPFSPETGLLSAFDDLRPINDELEQSTPPVGPTNTVSQVFFSADESMLFATVKGDPDTGKDGFFASWPVEMAAGAGGAASACVSMAETRSTPDGTAVLFGSVAIPSSMMMQDANMSSGGNVFVTDASFGAAILSVDSATMEATTLASQEIDGQVATCWAAVSDVTGTAFVTDVGRNRIIEMSLQDASILGETDLQEATAVTTMHVAKRQEDGEGDEVDEEEGEEEGEMGLIDLAAGGNFVYALAPGDGMVQASVSVLDVSGGQGSARLVQQFPMGGLGVGENSMGMAVLM